MGIPDPCGSNIGYKQIVAIYIKFLKYGGNYTNKDGLRAATLVGYAKVILILFTLQGSPVDQSGPNNMGGIIIKNHEREEDIASQRYPLNSANLAKLGTMVGASCSEESEQNLIFDIVCLPLKTQIRY